MSDRRPTKPSIDMARVFAFVTVWFVGWIAAGVIIIGSDGVIVGFFLAYITGFALPWIAPNVGKARRR